MTGQTITAKAGETVLWASYASAPGDWIIASVLWADADEFLSQHEYAGYRHRQVMPHESVRMVAPISDLVEFRRQASVAVRDVSRRILEAEAALNALRAERWSLIDALRPGQPPAPASEVSAAPQGPAAVGDQLAGALSATAEPISPQTTGEER